MTYYWERKMISKLLELFTQRSPYERVLHIINKAERVGLPSGQDLDVMQDKFILVGDLKLSDSKLTILFDSLDKNIVVKRYGEVIFMSEEAEEILEVRNKLFELYTLMRVTETANIRS